MRPYIGRMIDGDRIRSAFSAGDYPTLVALVRAAASPEAIAGLDGPLPREIAVEAVGEIQGAASDAEAMILLGTALWEVPGSELLAMAIMRSAVEAGSQEGVLVLAEALEWFGAHEQAIPLLENARRRGAGESAKIAALLGRARNTIGEGSADVEALLREGATEHPWAGVEYAKVLSARGAYQEAAAILQPLVQQQEYGAALLLGNLLCDELHDQAGAMNAYLEGIATGDAFSALNLAIMLWQRGDALEADRFRRLAREMGDLTEWPDEDFWGEGGPGGDGGGH